MKAITLRNLPAEVARVIRQRARDRGWSLNRTVIHILEQALGLFRKKPLIRHHDLDPLIGSWTAEQAREFDRALERQRAIDPELWR